MRYDDQKYHAISLIFLNQLNYDFELISNSCGKTSAENAWFSLYRFKVCTEAEAAIFNEDLFYALRQKVGVTDNTHTTAIAAVEAAHKCHAKAIMVVTVSGR